MEGKEKESGRTWWVDKENKTFLALVLIPAKTCTLDVISFFPLSPRQRAATRFGLRFLFLSLLGALNRLGSLDFFLRSVTSFIYAPLPMRRFLLIIHRMS